MGIRLSLLVIGAVWMSAVPARDLDPVSDLWRSQHYQQVIETLLQYRDEDFAKDAELDYILATSCCRNPGDEELGIALLNNILHVYQLSDENLDKVLEERTRCGASSASTRIAFLSSQAAGGVDRGDAGDDQARDASRLRGASCRRCESRAHARRARRDVGDPPLAGSRSERAGSARRLARGALPRPLTAAPTRRSSRPIRRRTPRT